MRRERQRSPGFRCERRHVRDGDGAGIDGPCMGSGLERLPVIARDGIVTLKGPVHSDTEKTIIEAKAVAVAGQGKVNNEIRVISKKPDSYR